MHGMYSVCGRTREKLMVCHHRYCGRACVCSPAPVIIGEEAQNRLLMNHLSLSIICLKLQNPLKKKKINSVFVIVVVFGITIIYGSLYYPVLRKVQVKCTGNIFIV